MLNTECISCTNTNCIIKKNIAEPELQPYLEKKGSVKIKKSQRFILENTPVNGLYFVFEGSIKVVATGVFGREQILRFGNKGEMIGHRGFGSDKLYHIGAATLEDSVLCYFNNDVLEEMLRTVPKLTFDLMIFYADELNRSETKIRKLSQMTVREKVIDTFLYLKRKFGVSEDEFLNIKLLRKEIADYAGTTEEQVIRVISALKREGLVDSEGKRIGLKKPDRLKMEIAEHNYFIDS